MHTWDPRKRIFKSSFGRRFIIFGSLVGVISYAAEIWGWKRIPELENVRRRYLMWILGVGFLYTNWYLVRGDNKGGVVSFYRLWLDRFEFWWYDCFLFIIIYHFDGCTVFSMLLGSYIIHPVDPKIHTWQLNLGHTFESFFTNLYMPFFL